MNETIIKGFIQLVAYISTSALDGKNRRDLVLNILKDYVSPLFIDSYINLFDNYLISFSVNKQNVSADFQRICSEIRKNLVQQERIILYIKILEYAKGIESNNSALNEIIDDIAHCFSINVSEAENLKKFTLNTNSPDIEQDKILVIQSNKNEVGDLSDTSNSNQILVKRRVKSIEGLDGIISLMFISSANSFAFRFSGDDNLYLDGMPVEAGKTYLVDVGAIIRGANISPIYYADISKWFFLNPENQPIFFSAQELEYNFRNSPNGIKSFSFGEE
jgi:ABC transport system ATP-binding/permease protein